MHPKIRIALFCVSFAVNPLQALAEPAALDPLFQGRTVELGFGLYAPMNSLQDTLTTRNGGGPQVQSTDALGFGTGGRVSLTYSNPWGDASRLVVNLTGAGATGTSKVQIGTASETFPGSYDDGFSLPANWYVDTEVDTRSTMLTIGREWLAGDGWRFSAGVQGGTASQDFTGLLRAVGPGAQFDGELWRTITTRSQNRMLGVYGGVSHYMPMGNSLALRLSGSLGVLHNAFDYDYSQVINAAGIPPSNQSIQGSDSRVAFSTRVSARLEHALARGGLMTVEVGYDGLHGIGNGVDTFLDAGGTNEAAKIDSDTIGAGYLSVGYVFQF